VGLGTIFMTSMAIGFSGVLYPLLTVTICGSLRRGVKPNLKYNSYCIELKRSGFYQRFGSFGISRRILLSNIVNSFN